MIWFLAAFMISSMMSLGLQSICSKSIGRFCSLFCIEVACSGGLSKMAGWKMPYKWRRRLFHGKVINGAFSIARFDYLREVTIWIPGCWKNLAWVLLYSSLWPVMREELRTCSSFAGCLSLLRDHWPYKNWPVFGWLHPHKLFFSPIVCRFS